ncbi:helix-turn-helix domain-containing protein [Streptosporangium vulgare]|uniref:Winged helix-turn-helix domain-containing protein n=1 Tax=Streptosporangium vulgare TaxID=46190 RepID=A0ABV5TED0_9ACTN
MQRLEAELERGPAVHGWRSDQRWTLARVAVLIAELFRTRYTPRGVAYLLRRLGWSPQVPIHRAAERDEEEIATWVKEVWPDIKALWRPVEHG